MAKKRRKRKSRTTGGVLAIVAVTLVLVVPGSLLVWHAYAAHRLLVPVSLFALLAGIMYEYRLIAEKWSTVLWSAVGAYAASFLAFIPGKHERDYSLEAHIALWPYVFCGALILIAVFGHKERVTPRLNEGFAFLQTIALCYWLIDAGVLHDIGPWTMVLLLFVGVLSILTTLHALLPLLLSRSTRLWLSLWSSSMMLFLAIDNIRSVYSLGNIEDTQDPITVALIIANYFLLGISSIYMAQNLLMLAGFLPGRGTFFNKEYFKDINLLKKDHIKRFSMEQAPFMGVLLCTLYACGIFGLNMHYQWGRSNFAIWLVFFTFPWFLGLIKLLVPQEGAPVKA